ncbi:hypothetical protein ACN38_g5940 [Penicillium nordicum]|uniref:Uncharacterized protein n=1 Tax=Penicillium nordicum TaxID=229535 RepID=A0A0M8P0R3_9EURO|nr:hypothetical protein ACN38_g5940 [Penicillium nordicum]
MNMERELHPYHLLGVAFTQYFWETYYVIDGSTVALEWLDTTFEELKYQPSDISTHSLIVAVLIVALTSCVVLEDSEYVNTGKVPILNIGTSKE